MNYREYLGEINRSVEDAYSIPGTDVAFAIDENGNVAIGTKDYYHSSATAELMGHPKLQVAGMIQSTPDGSESFMFFLPGYTSGGDYSKFAPREILTGHVQPIIQIIQDHSNIVNAVEFEFPSYQFSGTPEEAIQWVSSLETEDFPSDFWQPTVGEQVRTGFLRFVGPGHKIRLEEGTVGVVQTFEDCEPGECIVYFDEYDISTYFDFEDLEPVGSGGANLASKGFEKGWWMDTPNTPSEARTEAHRGLRKDSADYDQRWVMGGRYFPEELEIIRNNVTTQVSDPNYTAKFLVTSSGVYFWQGSLGLPHKGGVHHDDVADALFGEEWMDNYSLVPNMGVYTPYGIEEYESVGDEVYEGIDPHSPMIEFYEELPPEGNPLNEMVNAVLSGIPGNNIGQVVEITTEMVYVMSESGDWTYFKSLGGEESVQASLEESEWAVNDYGDSVEMYLNDPYHDPDDSQDYVGVVMLSFEGTEAKIDYLEVNPNYRGRGVGASLYEKVREWVSINHPEVETISGDVTSQGILDLRNRVWGEPESIGEGELPSFSPETDTGLSRSEPTRRVVHRVSFLNKEAIDSPLDEEGDLVIEDTDRNFIFAIDENGKYVLEESEMAHFQAYISLGNEKERYVCGFTILLTREKPRFEILGVESWVLPAAGYSPSEMNQYQVDALVEILTNYPVGDYNQGEKGHYVNLEFPNYKFEGTLDDLLVWLGNLPSVEAMDESEFDNLIIPPQIGNDAMLITDEYENVPEGTMGIISGKFRVEGVTYYSFSPSTDTDEQIYVQDYQVEPIPYNDPLEENYKESGIREHLIDRVTINERSEEVTPVPQSGRVKFVIIEGEPYFWSFEGSIGNTEIHHRHIMQAYEDIVGEEPQRISWGYIRGNEVEMFNVGDDYFQDLYDLWKIVPSLETLYAGSTSEAYYIEDFLSSDPRFREEMMELAEMREKTSKFKRTAGPYIDDLNYLRFENDDLGNNHRFVISPEGEVYSWPKDVEDSEFGIALMALMNDGINFNELDEYDIYDWTRFRGQDNKDFYVSEGWVTGNTSGGGFLLVNDKIGMNPAQIEAMKQMVETNGFKSIVYHSQGKRNFFKRKQDLYRYLNSGF